jgi:N-acetylmuramic acid 6-phosphate etherase
VTAAGRGVVEPLHELSTARLLQILQVADAEAVAAAHAAAEATARAVDALVEAWPRGGRLIYVGTGTSGRIGALDAAECRPTFGIEEDRVLAIVAGGAAALARAVEGAEDDEEAGIARIAELDAGPHDVVVALSASGATPFTCAALEEAGRRGCRGVAVTAHPSSRLAAAAAIPIIVAVGDEVVDGSTRMKAGTAQKLVCNAISTAAFIRLGRVWGNRMVAVQAGNAKLRRRALAIVEALAGVEAEAARALLEAAGGDLPTALVMGKAGVDRAAAAECLRRAHGNVPEALRLAGGGG